MLGLVAGTTRRFCDGTSRREFLRAGAATAFGLSLPSLLQLQTVLAKAGKSTGKARAKNLIVFALEGGPAHQDTWDMKPDSPVGIRSAFRPIETTVPGLLFCEHLPLLARQAHHLTLVRSVHHSIVDHNAGYYLAMTGKDPAMGGRLIVGPSRDNFPPFGAVVAKLKPSGKPLPDFVQTPDWMSNLGQFLPGQDAGFLGAQFDPFLAGDPSMPDYQVPGLRPPKGVSLDRMSQRRGLLEAIDHTLAEAEPLSDLDLHYRKAFELIASPQAKRAFNLSEEPPEVRQRYGLDPDNTRKKEARQFGGLPHLGQCLLLARRLIEAGVRVVTVCTGARYDQTWDTHRQHFPLLEKSILPMFDQGFSALLEDMHQRGLLDDTLVVAIGEFGRTPKIGQITSDAGADKNGRDHWPHCYTALFAGGGMPAGTIHGASDRDAAYPAAMPVTPADITATVYQALGIAPDTIIHDPRQDRPHFLSSGTPIAALIG